MITYLRHPKGKEAKMAFLAAAEFSRSRDNVLVFYPLSPRSIL